MGKLALIIPIGGHVSGGPVPPQLPVDPGWGVGRPPVGIWPNPPVDPGYGRPIGPPHVGGGPIYNPPVDPGFGQPMPPVDPGWGQGHPIPPYVGGGPVYPPVVWPRPPLPVDPGWGQGHPIPPTLWPGRPPVDPGWGQGRPLPPYATTGPVYPPGEPPVFPIAPQPPPPSKPEQGVDPIPIGDQGWSLQFWRGVGWVLVPPEEKPPTA